MTSLRSRSGSPFRARYYALWPGLALAAIVLVSAALRLWQLHLLPPALYYDTAINGSDVRLLNSGAGLPVFFPANTGREPLFIYLQALSVALLGPTSYALYLVSAIIGILTIPAVYCLALELWPPARTSDGTAPGSLWRLASWPALGAAAALAVSYWHVSLSRRGLRTIMLPLASTLAVAFFWRAWTGRRYRDYVFTGVSLAAALYAYTAARLLPSVFLVFVLIELAGDLVRSHRRGRQGRQELWHAWRPRLVGLALLIGVTGALLLPLAVVSVQHPGLLSARIDQISILSASGDPSHGGLDGRLAGSLLATIRSFYDAGDLNARTNLPGRPANDPLLAILFTLGIFWSLIHIRESRYRLPLIWLGIMLVPVALSTDAPNFVRGSGAIPPMALLCGAGVAALLALLPSRSVTSYGPAMVVVAVLLVSGALTARDYFIRWPAAPKFGDAFVKLPGTAPETTARMIAQLLPSSSADHPLLISYAQYVQPHTTFLVGPAMAAEPSPQALAGGLGTSVRFVLEDSFDPQEPLVLLWQEHGTVRSAALDPFRPSAVTTIRDLLGNSGAVTAVKAPGYESDGPVSFTGSLPAGVRLHSRTIDYPMDVRFENGVRLVGYNVEGLHEAGASVASDEPPSQVTLVLFWELAGSANSVELANSTVFVHLVDSQGNLHQANAIPNQAFLFGWLKKGQKLLAEDRHSIPVEADVPPGKAYFEVGWLRPVGGLGAGKPDRLAIVDGDGRAVGNQVDLGATMIKGVAPKAAVTDLKPFGAQFDNRIELVGWRADSDPLDPSTLHVDIAWRALDRSTTDYTAFVHLVDDRQEIVAQQDQPPGGTDDPTTRWVPGEIVRSSFIIKPPKGTVYKGMQLRVGLYEPISGKQLALTGVPNGQVSTSSASYLMLPLGQ